MIHGPKCPSVKALEYHPDGTVKRVEFVELEPVMGKITGIGAEAPPFGGVLFASANRTYEPDN